MNSFGTDLKRAVFSWGFVIGLILEILILMSAGFGSDIFKMCIPVLCTFPYGTAWLADWESGFLKACLPRTSVSSYIMGKILSSGISGGLLEALGCQIYLLIQGQENPGINIQLIFMSGALWAMISALLAALSKSRYLAYGGGFVLYYFLVILHERYLTGIYCLYPYEWFMPKHMWMFEDAGVLMLVSGILLIVSCLYYEVLRRCIENV